MQPLWTWGKATGGCRWFADLYPTILTTPVVRARLSTGPNYFLYLKLLHSLCYIFHSPFISSPLISFYDSSLLSPSSTLAPGHVFRGPLLSPSPHNNQILSPRFEVRVP
jgi:hypothetical protein